MDMDLIRRNYACDTCGLAASVRGGQDRGFYEETETRYCAQCQTLADLPVSLWCKEDLPNLLPPSRLEKVLAGESSFGHCPDCHQPAEQVWVAGDPCPKCGGRIRTVE